MNDMKSAAEQNLDGHARPDGHRRQEQFPELPRPRLGVRDLAGGDEHGLEHGLVADAAEEAVQHAHGQVLHEVAA